MDDTSRLATEVIALGDPLASYGIDSVDLDMIRRGDMLGSTLGEKVFRVLQAIGQPKSPDASRPSAADDLEAQDLAVRVLQRPTSFTRAKALCADAVLAARHRGEARMREIAVARIASMRQNRQQLRLQLGEMSAQEMRTLTAGLELAELAVRDAQDRA